MRIHVSAMNRVQEIRKDCENFSKRQPSLEFRLLPATQLVLFFLRVFLKTTTEQKKKTSRQTPTCKTPVTPPPKKNLIKNPEFKITKTHFKILIEFSHVHLFPPFFL